MFFGEKPYVFGDFWWKTIGFWCYFGEKTIRFWWFLVKKLYVFGDFWWKTLGFWYYFGEKIICFWWFLVKQPYVFGDFWWKTIGFWCYLVPFGFRLRGFFATWTVGFTRLPQCRLWAMHACRVKSLGVCFSCLERSFHLDPPTGGFWKLLNTPKPPETTCWGVLSKDSTRGNPKNLGSFACF